MYDAVPLALGRVFGGPPSVGSLDASWVETSPGVWGQWTGPWGMQVVAVPEPSIVCLTSASCLLLVGLLSGARSPRKSPW